MSTGYFDYQQYRIKGIVTEIEYLIDSNQSTRIDEFGCTVGRHYSKETIAEFAAAVTLLTVSLKLVDRIDSLVSGDDSEESFHQQLAEEVATLIEN